MAGWQLVGRMFLGSFPSGSVPYFTFPAGTSFARNKLYNCVAYGGGIWIVGGSSSVLISYDDGDSWETLSDNVLPATIQDVAYSDVEACFYALVTSAAAVYRSVDGRTWTACAALGGTQANRLRIIGNKVIVERTTVNSFFLSENSGASWSVRTTGVSGTATYPASIVYSPIAGLYVACGASGAISTSPDLVTWTARSSGVSGTFYSATYYEGKFVCGLSTGELITSTDGITWVSTGSPLVTLTRIYGFGSKIVTVNGVGSISIGSSIDTRTVLTHSSQMKAVGYNPTSGKCVFACNAGTILELDSSGIFRADADQTTSSAYKSAILFAGDIYFGGPMITRLDALHNHELCSVDPSSASDISSSPDYLLTATFSGKILTSTNGTDWITRYSGSTALYATAYLNLVYLVGGASGAIKRSLDGISWTDVSVSTTHTIKAFAYGNGTYLAVGTGSSVWTSPDGITWTERPTGFSITELTTVAFGNSTFVAAGSSGQIITSPDGITWTNRSSGTSDWLYGLSYLDGYFIVGGTGFVVTSPDGITWTLRSVGSTVPVGGVAKRDGKFYLGTSAGCAMVSEDLISWRPTYLRGGDLMVLAATYEGGDVLDPPVGWTLVNKQLEGNLTNGGIRSALVAYKEFVDAPLSNTLQVIGSTGWSGVTGAIFRYLP